MPPNVEGEPPDTSWELTEEEAVAAEMVVEDEDEEETFPEEENPMGPEQSMLLLLTQSGWQVGQDNQIVFRFASDSAIFKLKMSTNTDLLQYCLGLPSVPGQEAGGKGGDGDAPLLPPGAPRSPPQQGCPGRPHRLPLS